MQRTPSDIKLRKQTAVLEVHYADDWFTLPAEYLRVHSPSAEVQGHGPGQEILQIGKEHVTLVGIEPVGHYAVRLKFSDQHTSGIYHWDYLYELGEQRRDKWQQYLSKLKAAGHVREPQTNDKYLV